MLAALRCGVDKRVTRRVIHTTTAAQAGSHQRAAKNLASFRALCGTDVPTSALRTTSPAPGSTGNYHSSTVGETAHPFFSKDTTARRACGVFSMPTTPVQRPPFVPEHATSFLPLLCLFVPWHVLRHEIRCKSRLSPSCLLAGLRFGETLGVIRIESYTV